MASSLLRPVFLFPELTSQYLAKIRLLGYSECNGLKRAAHDASVFLSAAVAEDATFGKRLGVANPKRWLALSPRGP
jgi:hypothetical protein